MIYFVVVTANTATITNGDGDLVEVYSFQSTFRHIAVFAKIAGASEPTQRTFTIGAASATWVFAKEWNATNGFQAVNAGQTAATYDSSGAVYEVTSNIASAANSLLLAVAYTSNTTTANKAITSGYDSLIYSGQGGTSQRLAITQKVSSANDSATLTIVDHTVDSRISLVLVEFKENDVVTPSIDSVGPLRLGTTASISTSNFSPDIDQGSLGGKALTSVIPSQIVIPGFVDEQVGVPIGLNKTLIVGNGTQSAQLNGETLPPEVPDNPGVYWTPVTVGSSFDTSINSIAYLFNPALQEGDMFFNDATKGTVGTDASYVGSFEGTQVMWHWELATGIYRSFNVLTGSGGVLVSIIRQQSIGIGFGIGL